MFEVNDATKRYIEKSATQSILPNQYRNPLATNDSAACLTIKNTLAVTFEEEFNTLLQFGAMVYAMNECQRHTTAIGQTENIVNLNAFPQANSYNDVMLIQSTLQRE